MQSSSTVPAGKSVARQLMMRLALAGSLLSVLTSVFVVTVEYLRDIRQIDGVFTQIEEGYLGSVVETAWLEDRDRLALLVMGIERLPHVKRVEIHDPSGALMTAAGRPDPSLKYSHRFPLIKEYKGKHIQIGTMDVLASAADIRDDAIARGWIVGLTSLLLILLASYVVYRLVGGMIADPLGRLTESARNMAIGREDGGKLADLESRHAGNEFGILIGAFSDMRRDLAKTMRELKTSEARYRELFTSSPIALWEEDFTAVWEKLEEIRRSGQEIEPYLDEHPDFVKHLADLVVIVDVNDTAVRMHGAADQSELLGGLSRLFTPNSLIGFRKELIAMWNGQQELAFESEVQTLGGDVRDVIIHWRALMDSSGRWKRILIAQEDITELVVTRHSLAMTVEHLMEANSELERFTFAAAHDLAEPVRNVVSFSQLLERHLPSACSSEVKEYLDFLIAAGKRMERQVQGLQDYARIGEGVTARQNVGLNQLAERAVNLLREPIRLSQAEIAIQPLPVAYVNPDQISDVMRNLIDNALKFRRAGVPPQIRIWAEQREGEWTISVKDNGIGIDPRYASDVFQVFRRLNPPTHATGEGLGLSLSRRIIERHGGRIWVESNLGQGATFHFTLPCKAARKKTAGKLADQVT